MLPQKVPSKKSSCAILPHSSDVSSTHVLRGEDWGRPGRAPDALRSCSPQSQADMDNERVSTVARSSVPGPPPPPKTPAPRRPPTSAVQPTTASNAVCKLLLNIIQALHMPAHCQPLPLLVHPSHFTLVFSQNADLILSF